MNRDAHAGAPVAIVGAGLAGLACARHLAAAGVRFLLLEASDDVGGRVRTDPVEGFLLDRGFQVYLSAYPEGRRVLDLAALRLRPFRSGALVRCGGRFHRLADPWREPLQALGALASPLAGVRGALAVARLRRHALAGDDAAPFERPEVPARVALAEAGVPRLMIDAFFRPFLGGVFLDPEVGASSRAFEFVFRMFAAGNASLPAGGMQEIPRQLAAALPGGSIRFGARVAAIEPGKVRLEAGEEIPARAAVVATEGSAAARLLPGLEAPPSRAVSCLYFAAERSVIAEPVLVLNGEPSGLVNNLCEISRVAAGYAPPGRALLSVSVLGLPCHDGDDLARRVRGELRDWYGPQVDGWRHLRTYRIREALPDQAPPALDPPERPVRLADGLYVCGDHRDQGSIQGALVSGRRAAAAVLQDLAVPG